MIDYGCIWWFLKPGEVIPQTHKENFRIDLFTDFLGELQGKDS